MSFKNAIATMLMLVLIAGFAFADNEEPEAQNVYISPSNPTTSDDLTCNYTYFDEDGDSEGDTEIKWQMDMGWGWWNQRDYDDLQVLPSSATGVYSSEDWRCRVRPIAQTGDKRGDREESNSVTISNQEPVARINVDRTSAITNQNFNLDATTSTDAEDCPSGGDCGDLDYEWEAKCSDSWCNWSDIGDGATISESFSSPGTKRIRLTVEDQQGQTDRDEIEVTVLRSYSCNYSSFGPLDYDPSAPWDDVIALHPNYSIPEVTSIEVTGHDFRVGGWFKYAGIKAEVWSGGTKIREFNNRSSSFPVYTQTMTIDFSSGVFLPNQSYAVKIFRKKCISVIGTSRDDAYENDYFANSHSWELVEQINVFLEDERVNFTCSNFNYQASMNFNKPAVNDPALGGIVIDDTTNLNISNFGTFDSYCLDGVPGSGFKYVARASLTEAGGTTNTYYNTTIKPDGCFNEPVANSSILIPFASLGKGVYTLAIEALSCQQIEEIGVHGWQAFKNGYYCSSEPWVWGSTQPTLNLEQANGDGEILNFAGPLPSIIVNVFDPNNMQATISGGNRLFFFTPFLNDAQQLDLDWILTNTSTDNRFDIRITSVNFAAARCPFGACATSSIPFDLDEIGEEGSVLEAVTVTLQTYLDNVSDTETTIDYAVQVTYDDAFGLSTIPPKTLTDTVTVTFVPPPSDVLLVRDIKILPQETLSEDTDTFDVEVVVENFSGASFVVPVQLTILDPITNREITLTQTLPANMQWTDVIPDNSVGSDAVTVSFSGIVIDGEPEFLAGKSYWVKAELTNPDAEKVTVNDEKKALLKILETGREPVSVPGMNLASIAFVAFAVLAIYSLHRK